MSSQKGLVQRIERKLEVGVGDAFARVFGGSIVPREVEAMLRREAAEGIRPVAGDRLLAPNDTSLPSVCTTTRKWAPTRTSLRTLSLSI